MFDIGFWEMSVIALIALVVLGPERLPGVARTVGHWVGRARRMIREVKADIDHEIRNAEIKEMESLKKDFEETGREMSSQFAKVSDAEKTVKDEFDLSEAIKSSAETIGGESAAAQPPAPDKAQDNGKK